MEEKCLYARKKDYISSQQKKKEEEELWVLRGEATERRSLFKESHLEEGMG